MTSLTLPVPGLRSLSVKKGLHALGLFLAMLFGLAVAFPSAALDLVAFTDITGPLTSALTTLGTLAPGVKAVVGFISFVVALISLAALRNFSPVLFFVGVAIFAAVGLTIGGAILGLDVATLAQL